MKYEIRVPTEANTEFTAGPVIFREDGKALLFANVHGHGEACVEDLFTNIDMFDDGWWMSVDLVDQCREETKDDEMFETFYKEVK